MFARRQEINTQIQQVIDSILLALALLGAHTLRWYATGWFNLTNTVDPFSNYFWLLIVVMLFGPILLDLQGFYDALIEKGKGRSFAQIGRAMIYLSIIVSGCVIFLRLPLANRAVPILFIAIAAGVLLLKERITLQWIRARAIRGELREPVLLAGAPEDMFVLERSLTPEQRLQVDIVGRIDIEHQPLSDLVDAMHRHSVARVIFAASHTQLSRVEEAIGACEVEGVPAWLMADFIHTSIAKPDFDAFGGKPMLVFRSTPEVSWTLFVKEWLIDRPIALLLLLILAPFLIAIAIAIRMTSAGPVIFRQDRAGKHGKPFVMHKFRSMSNDAEMRRAELEPFNQMQGPVFKVEADPRVTPFGRWLRRTSMDELPQLVNVLLGDMSLVGPRPLPLYEVEKFENTAQRRRLSVKPGLTCLWQISGRNQVHDFEDWVKLDLHYIDHWSLALDLKILLRTVPAVITGLGAK
jgi:exopolysaccharide biosynthesis polyprenyl glycosylphosphotransferase